MNYNFYLRENQILIYSFPLALFRSSLLCFYGFFLTLTPDPKSLKKALISRSFRFHFLQTKNMSVGIRQPRLFLSVTTVGVDIQDWG